MTAGSVRVYNGNMRKEEAAWLAAAVDGEGSVLFLRARGKGKAANIIRVVVHNTNRPFVEEAHRIAKAGRIGGPYLRTGRQPMFWWLCVNQQAAGVLRQIVPFLIIKRRHAEIAIEVCELKKTNTGGGGPFAKPARHATRMDELRQELLALNKKGVRP